ncbi:MAG: hypothetical protein ACK5PQ_04670 [Alphaproteobacteria bacterium]
MNSFVIRFVIKKGGLLRSSFGFPRNDEGHLLSSLRGGPKVRQSNPSLTQSEVLYAY